jgi:hypothetical protein
MPNKLRGRPTEALPLVIESHAPVVGPAHTPFDS